MSFLTGNSLLNWTVTHLYSPSILWMCSFQDIRILKSAPRAWIFCCRSLMALTETETPRLIYFKDAFKPIFWFCSTTCQFFPKWPVLGCKCFWVSPAKADWRDETVSWLLETVFEKWERVFRVTDAAGCSLRWNESTHYVRAIAVFKISLTLCVSICRAFGWMGEAKRKEGRTD